MPSFESHFSIGDRVYIDGDTSGTATVTAFVFKPYLSDIEVSYVANGAHQQFWVAPWRLTVVKTAEEENYPRLPSDAS